MAPFFETGSIAYEDSKEGSEVIDLLRMGAALTLIAAGFSLSACSSGQAPVGTNRAPAATRCRRTKRRAAGMSPSRWPADVFGAD